MKGWSMLFVATVVATLTTPTVLWAGAGNVNYHCIRDAVLLPHVCSGGASEGQQCSVSWQVTGIGPLDCLVIDQGDCGPQGTCVIDYTSGHRIKTEVVLMLDDDATMYDTATASQIPINKALTLLLCVEHKGTRHCFTETYLGDPASSSHPILLPPFSPNGEQGWRDTYGGLTKSEQQKQIIKNFHFSAPEGLINPEGDLAQKLRDLFQVTGLPVLTTMRPAPPRLMKSRPRPANNIGFDDHMDDLTGSVLYFEGALRFIAQ